jgi:hypothetical protein
MDLTKKIVGNILGKKKSPMRRASPRRRMKRRAYLQVWTKKLDDVHYIEPGKSETICGKPTLGNNYANDYKELDRSYGRQPRGVCTKCESVLEGR